MERKRLTGWKEIVPFVNLGGQKALRHLASAWGFPLRKIGRTVFVFVDDVELWFANTRITRKDVNNSDTL